MTPRTFDPVTLQILWNRLIGIVDEGAITLVRTSFSSVVQECNDYACVDHGRPGPGPRRQPAQHPDLHRHAPPDDLVLTVFVPGFATLLPRLLMR